MQDISLTSEVVEEIERRVVERSIDPVAKVLASSYLFEVSTLVARLLLVGVSLSERAVACAAATSDDQPDRLRFSPPAASNPPGPPSDTCSRSSKPLSTTTRRVGSST